MWCSAVYEVFIQQVVISLELAKKEIANAMRGKRVLIRK